MTLDQIKNHKFPKNIQVKPKVRLKTCNINPDGTAITIEFLKDYKWDHK